MKDDIFVFGGHDKEGYGPLKKTVWSVKKYSPAADVCETVANLCSRVEFCLRALQDEIYLVGSRRTDEAASDSCFEFGARTDHEWKETGKMIG